MIKQGPIEGELAGLSTVRKRCFGGMRLKEARGRRQRDDGAVVTRELGGDWVGRLVAPQAATTRLAKVRGSFVVCGSGRCARLCSTSAGGC